MKQTTEQVAVTSKPCKSCEAIAEIKAIDRKLKGKESDIRYEYKCAVVSDIYRNHRFTGRSAHKAMPLRYCPECGNPCIRLKRNAEKTYED